MNFLAHVFLAEDTPDSRLGNLLGDFIKGRIESLPYPPAILKGIQEHRAIDRFTDHHPSVKMAKSCIQVHNQRYAGIAIDVFFDHFLAKEWARYSQTPLPSFAAQFYQELWDGWDLLPPRLQFILPYMSRDDWFTNYGTLEGIERTIVGLHKRMQRQFGIPLTFEDVLEDFQQHYTLLSEHFTAFFPELQAFMPTLRKAGTPFVTLTK